MKNFGDVENFKSGCPAKIHEIWSWFEPLFNLKTEAKQFESNQFWRDTCRHRRHRLHRARLVVARPPDDRQRASAIKAMPRPIRLHPWTRLCPLGRFRL